jgi:hypothetical protein
VGRPIGVSGLSNSGVEGLDRRFATIFEGKIFWIAGSGRF